MSAFAIAITPFRTWATEPFTSPGNHHRGCHEDGTDRIASPYTVDNRNRIAYVCLGNHIGFDVVDLETGKVLDRV